MRACDAMNARECELNESATSVSRDETLSNADEKYNTAKTSFP